MRLQAVARVVVRLLYRNWRSIDVPDARGHQPISFLAYWVGCPGTGKVKSEKCSASTTWQRLAEEKACLEHLDAERAYRGDSGFGKATEDRIVWRELLDLELQDIDEQVRRICQAAGDLCPALADVQQRS